MMKRTILAAFTLLLAVTLQAQKRVNNRLYNPDPAPVVSGDRLYVFTGHDLDTATYFRMPDWQLFSTTDMEHWTDHGIVLTTANFKWAKQGDNAWASQAIERNGKWYWYVAAEDTTKHLHGIGVAVADRPEGPWTDPLGKPLIPGDWGFIDPTVFIDDDGQAWLFWGNNGCWYAKLNEDMISIDTSFANNGICDMRPMLDDEAQFGPKCLKMDYQLHKRVMKTGFEEAPWIYKIGDTYFLEYAAGGVPEHWAYSTAKSIHGPWHYEGRITDESPGSFTIHGGTIDFKGKSYLFYHDGIPSGGNGFRRTTAYREFQRMKDGRIPKINIEQSKQLIYCSCAYTNYGLPAGEISHSYYELIADKGKKPRVVYCEERGREPEKKDYPATEKDVKALYDTLQELNVDSLDGYRVSEDMMGGTSYRIHVEYADGRQVTADWFTHSPKGKAVSAYEAILRHLSAIASRPRTVKKK